MAAREGVIVDIEASLLDEGIEAVVARGDAAAVSQSSWLEAWAVTVMSGAVIVALLLLVGSTPAWSLDPASPVTNKPLAARIKRASVRCEKHPNIDACTDAIRWSPSDPLLLIGLGDALMRANRPADALRHYQRAAVLAPNLRAVTPKITAAEMRLSSGRHPATVRRKVQALPRPARVRPPAMTDEGKRYSNADPQTQSH